MTSSGAGSLAVPVTLRLMAGAWIPAAAVPGKSLSLGTEVGLA